MLSKEPFNDYNNDGVISNLEKLGFQVIDGLVPLYRMVYNLDQYSKLSRNAKNRLSTKNPLLISARLRKAKKRTSL